MKMSESIGELSVALSKAQSQMCNANKSKDNPFFKSKYADLASCWDTCRKPLTDNGLAILQPIIANKDGVIVVKTILTHGESGQYIESDLPMSPVKNDPQGVGSAITYARRYALMGMIGLAPSDDDGEAAMGRNKKDSNPIFDEIASCVKIDQLEPLRLKMEKMKDGPVKSKASAAFVAKMSAIGARWSKSNRCFVSTSSKDRHWYEDQADKASDVMSWWEENKTQALKDLSESDFGVVERLVSQIIDARQSNH
jgi:hypothetical protein